MTWSIAGALPSKYFPDLIPTYWLHGGARR